MTANRVGRPCSRQKFAAPPEQVSAVLAYSKIVNELRKSMNIDKTPELEKVTGDEPNGRNGDKKKNGDKKEA